MARLGFRTLTPEQAARRANRGRRGGRGANNAGTNGTSAAVVSGPAAAGADPNASPGGAPVDTTGDSSPSGGDTGSDGASTLSWEDFVAKLETILPNFGNGSPFDSMLTDKLDINAPDMSYQNYQRDALHNRAQELLNEISGQAQTGSIQNFDRAANRLRDRVAVEAGAQRQNLMSGSRPGFAAQTNAQLGALNRAQMGSYAQGLVDLEKNFEDARLAGLNIASGAAGKLGDVVSQLEALAQKDAEASATHRQQSAQWLLDKAQFERENLSENQRSLLDAIVKMSAVKGGALGDLSKLLGD